jgi:hypothetical protein
MTLFTMLSAPEGGVNGDGRVNSAARRYGLVCYPAILEEGRRVAGQAEREKILQSLTAEDDR